MLISSTEALISFMNRCSLSNCIFRWLKWTLLCLLVMYIAALHLFISQMMYIKTHHLLSFQLGDQSRLWALPSQTGGVHVCRAEPNLRTHPGLCEKSKNCPLTFCCRPRIIFVQVTAIIRKNISYPAVKTNVYSHSIPASPLRFSYIISAW